MKTFLLIFGIFILIVVLLLLIVCGYIFQQMVWRKTLPLPKFISKIIVGNEPQSQHDIDVKIAEQKLLEKPIEKISKKMSNGDTLIAHLLHPKKSNGKLILACHGARSSGTGEFAFISSYFYENGFTLFMPDHRGCGESCGKFMGYGTHESKDTLFWLDYVENKYPEFEIYLMGVSMGAATVLMMSDKIKSSKVKGIIADCSYTSAWDEFSYQIKNSFNLPEFPILHICNLYCKCFAGYSFKDASPIKAVKNANCPILFIHGGKDDFVPTFMVDKLFNKCTSPKEKVIIEQAVHARSYYTDPEKYIKSMNRFIDNNSVNSIDKLKRG